MEFEIFATEHEDAPPRFYGCLRDDVVVGPFEGREEAEAALVGRCSDPGSPLAGEMADFVSKRPIRWGSHAVGGTASFGVWEFHDGDGKPFYVVIGQGGVPYAPVSDDPGPAELMAGQLQAAQNGNVRRPK